MEIFNKYGLNKTYDIIKEKILKGEIDTNYKEEIITQEYNITFQFTNTSSQENSEDSKISKIHLNDCEDLLKEAYNIPDNLDLLIYKIDIKKNTTKSTQVEYEVYHPVTKEKLNMTICENTHITIVTPVNLDDNTLDVYNNTMNQGYDIFDINSEFYNDICTQYNSNDGTDVTLSDRADSIYPNISICEDNCEYEGYNSETGNAICNCNAKTEVNTNLEEEVFHPQKLIQNLYEIDSYTNIRIMKCVKLAFSSKGISKNYLFYLFFFMLILYIASMIYNLLKSVNQIKSMLYQIVSYLEENFNKNINNDIPEHQNNNKIDDVKKIEEQGNNNEINHVQLIKVNKNENEDNIFQEKKTKKKKKKKKHKLNKQNCQDGKTMPDLKIKSEKDNSHNFNLIHININQNSVKLNNYAQKMDENLAHNPPLKFNKSNETYIKQNNINSSSAVSSNKKTMTNNNSDFNQLSSNLNEKLKHNKIEKNSKEQKKILNKIKADLLIDEELNRMDYNKAIINDKRSLMQIYIALLKRKHIIILTFFGKDDYNVFTLKLSLFILSISLYLAINTLFFRDDVMHNIYVYKGKYNWVYQLPQTIYSTIISAIISTLLRKLCLTQNYFIKIKAHKTLKEIMDASVSSLREMKKRMIIFLLIGLVLFCFFWYYVTCFGAVYQNAQKDLLKDTLCSFFYSMAYPFGLNIIYACLRLLSLKNKKRECLYKFSKTISLI